MMMQHWWGRGIAGAWIAAFSLTAAAADEVATKAQRPTVDVNGTIHIPAFSVPYSSLASEEAKRHFLKFVHGFDSIPGGEGGDINAGRRRLDDQLMRPGVERLRSVFDVEITPEMIGGVQTDVVVPKPGIARKNAHRVLINLHGGGFMVGARFGGQMESIPIASLGAIKVITVDYREGPEHSFPAASEDVAKVYSELLKRYRAENIGIYGCSAGGMLTAESVAWFQTHQLPRPGAIGIFGSGALVPMLGDSNYMGAALMASTPGPEDAKKFLPYFDVPGLDLKDPLVSPVYSPLVLASFPPSLLITGTRDSGLSPAAYTHAQLTKAGVEAALHVWEGAAHCSFAQPVVDPAVPETRQAWDVTVKFFDKHLGKRHP
ncbi:MAG: alpha/beta hydrolase [Acidobacteria bacterium]|nr:alpha/beta hydrolase [Acidobacteriota bacterium]